MPWNKVEPMEERHRFVYMAVQPDANISELSRKFGISRKTGYKLISRYKAEGLAGILERSRRPKTTPNAVSAEMVCEIVALRTAYPTWAGTTFRSILLRSHGCEDVPNSRTIDRILDRCGLVQHRKRRGKRIYYPEQVIRPKAVNDVWTIDFKGHWQTKDGQRCIPLTVRDDYSRYILDIGALTHGTTEQVRRRLEDCFERYGMPLYMRSDNGAPFSASEALRGLSELAVWWIKLGIMPNRIPPASPCYNGGHERMHKDLKAEVQSNPARNSRQQQYVLDAWREQFNTIRPHRALKMRTPAECYTVSERSYQNAQKPFRYEPSMELRKVGARGAIWWKGTRHFVAGALARETIAIESNADDLSVWFCNFFLGTTDKTFYKIREKR
jgi:putative transposase